MRTVVGWTMLCALVLLQAGGVLAAGAGSAGGAGEPLRYAPKAGQQAVYEVTIEATLPDSVETRTGQIIYDYKSVDATTGQFTFTCFSQLQTRSTPKSNTLAGRGPGGFGPPPGMMRPPMGLGRTGMMPMGPAEITVNTYGEVVSSSHLSDNAQLPFMLGYDWSLLIEPLSADNRKTWKRERDIAVTNKVDSWPPLPPLAANDKTARSAKELTTYTLAAGAGDTATIRKVYNLDVPRGPDGAAAIQQNGQGQFVFSRRAGLTTSLDMEYTNRTADDSVVVAVPVKVKARLLSEEEAAKVLADRKAKIEALKARVGLPQPPLNAATAAEVDAMLRDLQSGSQPTWVACQKLAYTAMLPERQKAVIAVLSRVLQTPGSGRLGSQDGIVRQHAARALGVWGTAREVPLLAPYAASEGETFVQMAAVEALGRIGTPEAAEAIAAGFYIRQGRQHAITALQRIGAPAEPAVLALLKDRGGDVRADACQVLATIGTQASIKPLQDLLAREKDSGAGLTRVQAEQALRAIEKRQQPR